MKMKQDSGKKFIFWVVIVIMIMGSVFSYSAIAWQMGKQTPDIVKKEIPGLNAGEKNIEGVVKKMTGGDQSKPTYYLEVAGQSMAILTTSDVKIDLAKYADKNVKIQGKSSGDSDMVLDVTKITEN